MQPWIKRGWLGVRGNCWPRVIRGPHARSSGEALDAFGRRADLLWILADAEFACDLPAAWDYLRLVLARSMGPPGLPVMGPPAGSARLCGMTYRDERIFT
jgi:hypothetical protein